MTKSKAALQLISAILFTALACLLSYCKRDSRPAGNVIRIRIAEEPDMISPIFSRTAIAGQLSEKIFLPLADYDPADLQLRPVLLKDIPTANYVNGLETYHLELLEGIQWQDGTPLTVNDIATTYKLLLNPAQEAASVRSTLRNLYGISADPDNARKFLLQFKGKYHLDLEAALNIPILPAATYDKAGAMDKYTLTLLGGSGDSLMHTADSTLLKNTAEAFKAAFKTTEGLNGNGAYRVAEWLPAQRITLTKKADWWGDKYAAKNKMLTALPGQLVYLILPDEVAAANALSNGQIDILPDMPAAKMQELTEKNTVTDNFTAGCPEVMQYYYIALNNAQQALQDVAVRRALVSLVDADKIIAKLMDGKATRIYGPVLPLKKYYHAPDAPPKYDPAHSAKLLDEAGWKLKPGSQVRSRNINGKEVALNFVYLTTGKQMGKDMVALLADEAAKIGIRIEARIMEFPEILKLVKTGQYDLANMVTRQFPGLDDPYLAWHSSNAFGKGTNVANIQSPVLDSLTEQIRAATNEAERNKYYRAFQQEIYRQQPVIFLFAPQNCILVRKELDPQFSPRRPGYFENTLQ